jgi:pimeloyl-ACP methyl ester carboxylesterase
MAVEVSPREAEVLEAVGHHLTNAEIATQLFISVRTVESHVSALLRKLSVPDRRALASYAAAQRNHAAVRAPIEQEIRFCTAPDGMRLAWAKSGKGPTIVKAANWLTHLEYDWDSPVWRHWLEGLAERHTLIRYDERGCGLSDRETKELSLECWVADLETVVDAAGLNRFVLLGISQGAATAIAYAVRHPDRVDRVVLYGGYARGRGRRGGSQRQRLDALISAIRTGWADPDPAFRRLFTMLFLPEGSPQQMAWYDELQRRSTSAEIAVRLYEARGEVDVSALAPYLTTETLVAHARGDRVVPFEEGRILASLLPAAKLVPLESNNHILLPDEPAWKHFLAEFHTFLSASQLPPQA